MAGMLPGVEAARRRRVHQSNSGSGCPSLGIGSSPSSRRSSFSLFSPHSSAPFLLGQTRSRTYQDDENSKLGPLAREAKERLDEKLRAQRNSSSLITRTNSEESMNGRRAVDLLRTEVFGSKKSGRGAKKRMIGWAKLRWKSGEQQECAVCLDEFRVGDNLVNLPCAHRFHSACLVPWLRNNVHCPCCRVSILS